MQTGAATLTRLAALGAPGASKMRHPAGAYTRVPRGRIAGETTSEPRARTTLGDRKTLTRFAALSTLSRIAGEGGPSAQRWVGEGCRLTHVSVGVGG